MSFISKTFPLTENLSRANREFAKVDVSKFLFLSIQLALVLLMAYAFRIEEMNGMLLLLVPIFTAFIIHSFLPIQFRPAFFVLASFISFAIVLGVINTLIIIGIFLLFLSIAISALNFNLKVVLLIMLTIVLMLLRVEIIPAKWSALVIPIVGSMFMFRMIIFMYEIKKNPLEATIWQRMQYFFMLPNVGFPLFPIVDYKTFLQSYYGRNALDIYQKGIHWIFRGLLQLLIYRVIYMYFASSPSKVIDVWTLLVYLVSNYALLLKISGQAHLIVGILSLFGMDLPQIFNKYILASGFSDFWRRINIYWKDFVMKIFYYPLFFQFRKMGMVAGTVITLMIMFFLTWILHSYQFFWFTGSFPMTAVDGLFWGIFGVLVTINSVLQMKKSKKKSLGQKGWQFLPALRTSLKIVSMFVFMCLLWSLWSSISIKEWFSLISIFKLASPNQVMIIIGAVILLILIATLLQFPISRLQSSVQWKNGIGKRNTTILILGTIVILIARLHEYYLPEDSKFSVYVRPIEEERLNVSDIEETERGYYEPILSSNQLTESLNIQVKEVTPKDWHEKDQNVAISKSHDLLVDVLIPNTKTKFKGKKFEINSFGLRDKEYSLEKPKGTYRLALLGGSFEMGSGVEADEDYEALIEDRLNSEKPLPGYDNYEFFNFGVGGYGMTHCVKLVDSKVLKYDMNAVIYIAHSREYDRTIGRLYKQIIAGVDLEYDYLKKIIKDAGLKKEMPRSEYLRKLDNVKTELLKWGYKKMADDCKKAGVVPVWVFLPTLEGLESKDEYTEISKIALESGFRIAIDLSKVYDGHDLLSLWVQPWDRHPNPLGHQLIANLLYTELMKNNEKLLKLNL